MARFVNFGGLTQFRPGGLTRINANALTPISLSSTGIVQILGEAEGGPPGTDGVVIIDDPALAPEIFRSGPLADAIRIAFAPSGDVRIPGGAFRVLAYKTNAGLPSLTQLPGDGIQVGEVDPGGSTTTVIQLTTGGLVVNSQVGRWLSIPSGEKRRIVSNTAATVTVSPGFTVAPIATNVINILESQIILTSADWGAHTSQVSVEVEAGTGETFVATVAFEDTVEQSPELGGTSFLNMKYVGGAVFDSGVITPASVTATTLSFDPAAAPALNAYAGMLLRFPDGKQRLITGNTNADPSIITIDAASAFSAAEILELESFATAAAVIEVINVTLATASMTGATGAASGLSTVVTPVADNLSLNFNTLGLTTLRQLVDYINGNTNYEADIPNGVNGDTTLLSSFDFGTRATAVDVSLDIAVDPDNNNTFRRDLQALVDWVNNFSDLATAEKASVGATEGSELPAFTGGVAGTARDVPVYFVGGTRGTSSNSDFQAGFDALIEQRANHCVPLISEDLVNEGNGSSATIASVAAQLAAYVGEARGVGKNELGGYLGYKGDIDAILAQISAINDRDVQVAPQQMQFLNAAGTLVLQPEWGAAAAAAGMRSGANEVGEPLTFKYIKTGQLVNDPSWSPKSITDVNRLIQGGALIAETTATGIRWIRDLTTHLQDDNIAFIDGNTRDATRFVAYDLRQFLEDRFTGVKASPATAASIREAAAAKFADYLTNGILVESLDPETGTTIIPGFRRLRVTINGNVATLRAEIFVTVGVVFILNDLYLQLPTSAA